MLHMRTTLFRASWSSRALVAAAAIFAALSRGDAQEAATAGQGQPTFRVEANFVRVDVFPTIDGKAVRDLTAADFELLEDGVPQKIETFEHVDVRGGGPQETRREPNTVQEGRARAEDPRSRVFIVFLDTYHTGVAGSHPDAPEPAGRSLADKNDGTDTPAGTEPGTSGQGPGKA